MSTKTRPNARTDRQTDTPTPTSHAQRRYRQRINPREPEPADRLLAIDDEAGGELEAWL